MCVEYKGANLLFRVIVEALRCYIQLIFLKSNFFLSLRIDLSGETYIMTSYESEGPKVVDKFDGVNFHLSKFKMEMVMAEKELWEIVDGSEDPPHSISDPRVMQAYKRREKKAFAILTLNLSDSQLAHICSWKTPAEAWVKLCNIHETKS